LQVLELLPGDPLGGTKFRHTDVVSEPGDGIVEHGAVVTLPLRFRP
jgi:hypothetical protein